MKQQDPGLRKKGIKATEFLSDIEYLKVLGDPRRRNIIDILMMEGDPGLSFKGLAEKASLPPTGLAYHLRVLKDNGLVERGFDVSQSTRDYTRYRVTEKGLSLWSAADILNIGAKVEKGSGNHFMTIPRSITVFPMELGPRLIKLIEGD